MTFSTQSLNLSLGKKTICKNLSLTINPGEVWGLLGRNGVGKSTLLQALCGLNQSALKKIFYHDQPLHCFSRKSLAQKIGFLWQETTLHFPQTVFEYCAQSKLGSLLKPQKSKENTEKIKTALTIFDVLPLASRFMNTLSGGEKRRVALSALLTQNPMVYLLDEPLNHLDLYQQIKVLEYFKQKACQEKISVLFSLHDINLAKHFCDKLLLLFDHGETLQGETSVLMNNQNLSRLYHCDIINTDELKTCFFMPRVLS